MGLQDCIDQLDLKKYALGHLDEDQSEAVAAHLSACTRCEETMAGFDDTDDSMLASVREAAANAAVAPAVSPSEAVLRQIPNPWSEPDKHIQPTSTGEWIRDYELLEQLGQGGMGTVYKAVHARLQRTVAIKLLPSRRLRDPDAIGRFEREMRAIGRLDHPAIVRATDAGDADGTHFLVMDFVEGIDLSRLMKLSGPMDVASACEVIRQVAIALQYAHDQGLIHRDVKPSNLMVEVSNKDGQGSPSSEKSAIVKLLDLGLALFGAASEAVDELTTVGQLMGTLDYMAPEQADNSHDVDARADVYSLGATMFKLLTGTAPYETAERRTPLQKMKALATVDAPPVKTRQPALPDNVASIVDRMLLRDAALRYQTAAEVAQAVAPFCGGHCLVTLTQQAQSRRHAKRDEPSPGNMKTNKPGVHMSAAIGTETQKPTDVDRITVAGSGSTWPPRRLFRWGVKATFFALIIAAGILIRIKTDTGTLVIECASADVPIEIRQGNDTVKQLSLTTGENKVTLRSGSYEIVLPAEYDSLTLDSGKFELSRGGEWVARISENVTAVPQPAKTEFTAEFPMGDMLSRFGIAPGQSAKSNVVQLISDPIRQIEFQRLSDRYAERLRKIDELRDLKANAATKYGANHAETRTLNDNIERAQRESVEAREALQEMIHEAQAIAKNKPDDNSNPATTSTNQPLYSGKTFDQWLQVIETERSNEELAKAIDAIGILGHGDHDREAAGAILNVIGRSNYVNPQCQTDDEAKLIINAIRAMRGLDTDATVDVIASGFEDRAPSVHEFVLDGLLQSTGSITRGGGGLQSPTEQISLGKPEPLTSKLYASESMAVQLIQMSEMNDGISNPEKYPAIHTEWRSTDFVFYFIQTHVGINKPSPAVETYLRKFTVDPEAIPVDQSLPFTAASAAIMLVRHSPEDLHARIFVRTIQDNVRTASQLPATGNGRGGFSGMPASPLAVQLNAWQGLALMGKSAHPALPFMREILEHSASEISVYTNVVRLIRQSDENHEQSFCHVNMQLFALEVLAITETNDQKALAALSAEFTRLIGQAPGDGAFELTPGRQDSLLSVDVVIDQYGGGNSASPPAASPIDIELTNSCILAWKALTGSNPRFATDNPGTLATQERPPGVTVAHMPKFVAYSADEK